jgi:hypothetical protein
LHNNHKNEKEDPDKETIIISLQKYLVFVSHAFSDPLTMMAEAFTAKIAFGAVVN